MPRRVPSSSTDNVLVDVARREMPCAGFCRTHLSFGGVAALDVRFVVTPTVCEVILSVGTPLRQGVSIHLTAVMVQDSQWQKPWGSGVCWHTSIFLELKHIQTLHDRFFLRSRPQSLPAGGAMPSGQNHLLLSQVDEQTSKLPDPLQRHHLKEMQWW